MKPGYYDYNTSKAMIHTKIEIEEEQYKTTAKIKYTTEYFKTTQDKETHLDNNQQLSRLEVLITGLGNSKAQKKIRRQLVGVL